MDNRDYMKAFGEWQCPIEPEAVAKFLIHDANRAMYERDYVLVTNLCNGFELKQEISMTVINGAKERYKEFNKSLLEISLLSEEKKKEVSAQIDSNAEHLKQQWINIFQQKDITITE